VTIVRRITPEQRKRVIDLWLDGDSSRTINSKTGVSTGSVSNIIKEERKKSPDIDQLRKISILIKKSNSTIIDALRGANLLEKINELDITLDEVSTSLNLIEHYEDEASDVLGYAQTLRQIEKTRGKTYKEIVNELTETTVEIDTLKMQIKDYNRKKQELLKELSNLEHLKALQQKLDSHNISHSKLDEIIEHQLTLENMGFTPEIAEILANEMNKTGLTPENAARRIVYLLNKQSNLTDKNLSLALLEDQLKRSVKTLQSKEKNLETTIKGLKETKVQYDIIIENSKETYQLQLTNIEENKKRMNELKQEEENIVTLLYRAEQALYNFEYKANKHIMLKTIITLLAEPKNPLPPKLLFTTMIRLLRRLEEHIIEHQNIISDPENFKADLLNLVVHFGREYTIAK